MKAGRKFPAFVPNQNFRVMEIYTKTQTIETENGTLHIAQVFQKFSNVGLWRVDFVRKNSAFGHCIKSGLLNKPTKRQIQNYIDSYGL
jgi:hypothetical protein